MWVELEAGLGTGYLQRVESGRIAQPSRETVKRILDALGARFSERREIMELLGYQVSVPLPSEEDIRWARDVSRAELDAFPFPAHVLDCTTRLLSWKGCSASGWRRSRSRGMRAFASSTTSPMICRPCSTTP